ncbi:MAG: undecaprenyldiphospho-muramoylpentapeptide beta-N-acetylglucosaminyltransferase [Rhodothermaceae bacterium]|nr:undecaprenyldiphospho-muramoylpentapeptide beta-N-acetylglucosaminyltransferase [Rhodothermaceae bacterium]MYF63057.1 undecaprenyldiphospho-muramoylpentapeptide beta-N-acetylglucosaminyltransferase [Rhodothermaceae bacterium]
MKRTPRVLFAGGGTGGHVYPAIAIAQAIRSLVPTSAIAFAGTRDHLEWRAVPEAGFEIHPITISGFYRKQPLRNVSLPLKLATGLWQSYQLVNDFDADVAVGTGGYVSGPVLWAAGMRGRPIVAQEQNAYAGVTNRILGRRAAQVHIAFKEAESWFPEGRCRFSGNPVRRELTATTREASRKALKLPRNAKVLFVFGGSLGSQSINEAMAQVSDRILSDPDVHIIWQTGALYYNRMRKKERARLRVLQYVDRMDLAYAACDLVLARAGALTCSELLCTSTPAILVPSAHVAEDHQTKNARSMERMGAAIYMPEEELLNALVTRVPELLANPEQRSKMAAEAQKAAKPEAAMTIAKDILALVGWEGQT